MNPTKIKRRERFGALYNWYAASNSFLPPIGWRVMTYEFQQWGDWISISSLLGGHSVAGGKLKSTLKHTGTQGSPKMWSEPNTGASDLFGFSAIPGGRRNTDALAPLPPVMFSNMSTQCIFWSDTEYGPTEAYAISLLSNSQALLGVQLPITPLKNYGLSIRLIKEDSSMPPSNSLMDRDGNVYKLLNIYGNIITAENFKCTKLRNGVSIPILETDNNWAAAITPAMCYYDNDIKNS